MPVQQARKISIVEVGPRDGLQNETVTLSVEERVQLIRSLSDAGLSVIEAGSFVSPRWVPQMAGTDAVIRALSGLSSARLPVLIPNKQGLAAARQAGASCIAIFAPATDGFARANLNATAAESFERFAGVARNAVAADMQVRGYVSCAVHCPYEGWVSPRVAADLAARLMDVGCYEVSMCDTTGRGTVERAIAMAEATVSAISAERTAVHFHDTGGLALQSTAACIELGISTVDSAIAGLGGCPYSPGAKGNLATESLIDMLSSAGFEHGVDRRKLALIATNVRRMLGRSPPQWEVLPGIPAE
jgi:hydroxymethylglutaryl-CoA lyase